MIFLIIFLSFSPGSMSLEYSPESCRSVREVLSRAQERRARPTVPVVYGGDSHNAWAGDGDADDDQKHRSPNRSPNRSAMRLFNLC